MPSFHLCTKFSRSLRSFKKAILLSLFIVGSNVAYTPALLNV